MKREIKQANNDLLRFFFTREFQDACENVVADTLVKVSSIDETTYILLKQDIKTYNTVPKIAGS